MVSLRVFNCQGEADPDDVQAALDWIWAHRSTGPAVVLDSGSSWSPLGMSSASLDLRGLIVPDPGRGPGISVVAQAGDHNENACDYSPGEVQEAITVAATDSSDTRTSSNTGSCVDLFAPGINIQTAANTSDSANSLSSGSGFAAAVVTGMAARYLQANKTATPAQVSTALVTAATPNVVLNPASSPNKLAYVAPPAVNTVPGLPTLISAVTDVNAAQGTLTWQPPVNNGGATITGYRVSRDGTDSAGAGPWTTTVPATARSQVFPGLKTGSTYKLTVQAINSIGTGAVASGTITMTAIAPGIPTAFTATTTGTITWAPPTTTGGLPITGYRVSRDGTDTTGAGPWSAVVPATARTQTFPALKPGATYTFSVQAITAFGTGPVAAGPVTMAAVAPGVPTSVSLSKYTTGLVIMSWSPPTDDGGSPITSYRVTRNGTTTDGRGPQTYVVGATARSARFGYLRVGTTYTLTIQAINAVGAGPLVTRTVRF